MQIRLDIFPAIVAVAPTELTTAAVPVIVSSPATPGTYQIHSARIIITQDGVLIAQDGPQGPVLIFSEAYDPATLVASGTRQQDAYLTTVSGRRLAFKKDDACGCGSRLRTWSPFKGIVSSSQDPTT